MAQQQGGSRSRGDSPRASTDPPRTALDLPPPRRPQRPQRSPGVSPLQAACSQGAPLAPTPVRPSPPAAPAPPTPPAPAAEAPPAVAAPPPAAGGAAPAPSQGDRRGKVRASLLSGLRSGALERAVDSIPADGDAAAAPASATSPHAPVAHTPAPPPAVPAPPAAVPAPAPAPAPAAAPTPDLGGGSGKMRAPPRREQRSGAAERVVGSVASVEAGGAPAASESAPPLPAAAVHHYATPPPSSRHAATPAAPPTQPALPSAEAAQAAAPPPLAPHASAEPAPLAQAKLLPDPPPLPVAPSPPPSRPEAGGVAAKARALFREWAPSPEGALAPRDFAAGLAQRGLAPQPLDADRVLAMWQACDPDGEGTAAEAGAERWAAAFPAAVEVAFAAAGREPLRSELRAVAQEAAMTSGPREGAAYSGGPPSSAASTCLGEDDVRLRAFATVIWQQRQYIEELERDNPSDDGIVWPPEASPENPVLTHALTLAGAPTPPAAPTATPSFEPSGLSHAAAGAAGWPAALPPPTPPPPAPPPPPPALLCWVQCSERQRGRRGGLLFRRRRLRATRHALVLSADEPGCMPPLEQLRVDTLGHFRPLVPQPGDELRRFGVLDGWCIIYAADDALALLLVSERAAGADWLGWAAALPSRPAVAPLHAPPYPLPPRGAMPSPAGTPSPRRGCNGR
eukprot:TRINITY_DN2802_c0_g1_i1.p1 TRINITY_DN2802_c0_g1~~TRINITY_DN2802_c0_g1_i1.p1  ORF type:complete len:682 (+),score=122.11 TRINITY_DN2802_c0_g1_i1:74-2119(+)